MPHEPNAYPNPYWDLIIMNVLAHHGVQYPEAIAKDIEHKLLDHGFRVVWADTPDETVHLLSSAANAERLRQSIGQARQRGMVEYISSPERWKDPEPEIGPIYTKWSESDRKWVGLCHGFPNLSFPAETAHEALAGIERLVVEAIGCDET